MIKFLLRIDEKTMEKATALAKEHGLSINKEINSLIKMALINNYYELLEKAEHNKYTTDLINETKEYFNNYNENETKKSDAIGLNEKYDNIPKESNNLLKLTSNKFIYIPVSLLILFVVVKIIKKR